jgi:hypothetical protein
VIAVPEPLVYYRKRAGSVQLARFWDQRQGVLRLAENRRRGAAGQAPIDREEFAAELASAPPLKRINRRKRSWGMYLYRAGANDLVNGRKLRGALKLVLASIMDGGRVRSGVWNAIRARISREL